MTREITGEELDYLRSILRQLRGMQSFLAAGPVPMSGEALADNIEWLESFISGRESGAFLSSSREADDRDET